MVGTTPSLSRTVCPVLSKSSLLKWSLQSTVLSEAAKPSLLRASSHIRLLSPVLGNLKKVRNVPRYINYCQHFQSVFKINHTKNNKKVSKISFSDCVNKHPKKLCVNNNVAILLCHSSAVPV